jgi:diguanylate cyclase
MNFPIAPAYQNISGQWRLLIEQTSPEAASLLKRVADQRAVRFSDLFYDTMMQDPEAAAFLNHEEVNSRLHASMQTWVREVLDVEQASDIDRLISRQRHVGMVHARLNVKIELVLRGARLIKEALAQAILNSGPADALRVEATITGISLIDLAIEVMSAQYSADHETAARTDEAYRSFAATMNTSLERERLRTLLFDWENQLLQEVMIARPEAHISRIGTSSFGLWIRHKAPALFNHSRELAQINEIIDRVDRSMVPACQRELVAHDGLGELRRLVSIIVTDIKQIRYLVDAMFEHLIHLETGRDALTQLLSRRFLPTIMSREIALSQKTGKPFCVLMIDIDYFKLINDEYGHESGDRVLQHLAGIFVGSVRSGDFVFRHGGEEFVVICVEVKPEQALKVAEKIREAVQAEKIPVSGGARVGVTVSIGIAHYDGHPDYQRLIDRADRALYQAKEQGRNRIVVMS